MKSPLFTIYDFSWTATGVVMFITYIGMLVHIRRGNKNTWLTMMCVLLMVNNVGGIILGIGLYNLTVLQHKEVKYVLMMVFGAGLDYTGFCVAHYLLAVKYGRMAKNVPELLAGRPEPPPTRCQTISYWILLFLNSIVGFWDGAMIIIFRMRVVIHGQPPLPWISWSYNAAQQTINLL